MNFRQKLRATLFSDFSNLTKANGYNNSVAKVYKKYVPIEQLNPSDCPAIWFKLMADSIVPMDDAETIFEVTQEVMIACSLSVRTDTNNSGLISDASELMIEDLRAFLHKYKTVSTTIDRIPGILGFYIKRVEPYIDDELNNGIILIYMDVRYQEDKDTLEYY